MKELIYFILYGNGYRTMSEKSNFLNGYRIMNEKTNFLKACETWNCNMLLFSVGIGREDITRMLLALPGIRVNYQETGTRETALMKACKPGYHRSSKCIKMLLGMGSK